MHYTLHRHRSRWRWLLWVSLALVIILLATWLLWPHDAAAPTTGATATKKPTTIGEGVSTHMLVVGDVFWGRTVGTKALSSPQKYAHIVSGLNRSDWDKYDAHIANFECPITTNDVPVSEQIATLTFNCRPEFLPTLAKWFTAASQANNHTANRGADGLTQTRKNLQAAGIQYFGNYDMSQTDDTCEVITMPATTATTHKPVSLPVALCGFMYVVDTAPTDAQLAVMQKYAKVMPVIAMPHMGMEYRPTAEPEKVSAYHRMIDNGADVVIGAHPHVIQNSENYKGRLIAYSVGNFLFDQQSVSRATTLGLGVGLKLTIEDAKAAKIYEQVAPSCIAYKDACVAKLQAELKTRPKIDVGYDFACFDESRALGSVPHFGAATACKLADQQATLDKVSGLSNRW